MGIIGRVRRSQGGCQLSVSPRCICTGCAGMACTTTAPAQHCRCAVCCADCLSPPSPVVPSGNMLIGVRGGAGSGMTGFAGASHGNFDLALGSVHGVRTWWISRPDIMSDPAAAGQRWDPPGLRGVAGYQWEPGINEAYCKNGRGHVPPVDVDETTQIACGCGFWAYWDYSQPAAFGYAGGDRELPVAGVIEGSGRVLIGEKGFRSQRARVIALALPFTISLVDYTEPRSRLRRSLRGGPGYAAEPSCQMFSPDGSPLPDGEAEAAARKKHEQDLAGARRHADAWMAVIQDRLQQMYPDAPVFATVRGMLASVQLGEITPE